MLIIVVDVLMVQLLRLQIEDPVEVVELDLVSGTLTTTPDLPGVKVRPCVCVCVCVCVFVWLCGCVAVRGCVCFYVSLLTLHSCVFAPCRLHGWSLDSPRRGSQHCGRRVRHSCPR